MPTAQDFYFLFCNRKFKRLTKTIQDGYSGMYFALKILSEAKTPLSAGKISCLFETSTARTAVILSTLEKKGYITKSKDPSDARKTIVSITSEGETALQKRKQIIFSTIDELLSTLDNTQKEQFYELLQTIFNQ